MENNLRNNNFFIYFSQSVEEENTGLLLYRSHCNCVAFIRTKQLAGSKNIHVIFSVNP
jgi:hypothetical protein